MKSNALPLAPVPLSADEAGAMLHRHLKKHHIAIILLHWFNAVVWLVELATGAALIVSPHFRVAPWWYVQLAADLFGTRRALLQFHVAVGIAWIAVYLVYGVFGFRTYLRGEVLRNEIGLDRNDLAWLRIRAARLFGRGQGVLPPQGVYNAGQKLFALLVYAMVPLVAVTGLVMALRIGGPAAIGWAMVGHFVAVGAVVSGLMIHVYMGAVFPEEKPAFYSMVTGTVNELFAYNHHFLWWRSVKQAEQVWKDARHGAAPRPSAAGAPGPIAACPLDPDHETRGLGTLTAAGSRAHTSVIAEMSPTPAGEEEA